MTVRGTVRTRVCPSRSETGEPRQRRMRCELYHGIFAVLQNDNFPLRFRLPLNKKTLLCPQETGFARAGSTRPPLWNLHNHPVIIPPPIAKTAAMFSPEF